MGVKRKKENNKNNDIGMAKRQDCHVRLFPVLISTPIHSSRMYDAGEPPKKQHTREKERKKVLQGTRTRADLVVKKLITMCHRSSVQ